MCQVSTLVVPISRLLSVKVNVSGKPLNLQVLACCKPQKYMDTYLPARRAGICFRWLTTCQAQVLQSHSSNALSYYAHLFQFLSLAFSMDHRLPINQIHQIFQLFEPQ